MLFIGVLRKKPNFELNYYLCEGNQEIEYAQGNMIVINYEVEAHALLKKILHFKSNKQRRYPLYVIISLFSKLFIERLCPTTLPWLDW
jgi:hypothetical protein